MYLQPWQLCVAAVRRVRLLKVNCTDKWPASKYITVICGAFYGLVYPYSPIDLRKQASEA